MSAPTPGRHAAPAVLGLLLALVAAGCGGSKSATTILVTTTTTTTAAATSSTSTTTQATGTPSAKGVFSGKTSDGKAISFSAKVAKVVPETGVSGLQADTGAVAVTIAVTNHGKKTLPKNFSSSWLTWDPVTTPANLGQQATIIGSNCFLDAKAPVAPGASATICVEFAVRKTAKLSGVKIDTTGASGPWVVPAPA